MEAYQQIVLMAASRLLSYPTREDLRDVQVMVETMEGPEAVKRTARDAAASICRMPLHDLQELYVETFDMNEKLSLYLSAHEFGDSPKRGAALIKLQKTVSQAGYERVGKELADYIPMLYELIAVTSDEINHERLLSRLGAVTQRIFNQVPETSPYHLVFSMLMQEVFETPSQSDLEKMEQEREEADLEELPYPIMYG
ncbi:nitrate reductase molybdenum cofactor assembly chaperone [Lentibacillus cibarius]|uniref:Nitrate reductase molybdenum cofactor assembly chaperone n=1 Tax=Lentibacillus cibarius TaxID=2583219 RepID=A0A549YJ19_9BACI|nr:nitrate reductase molybdenum cofactor assembly chaperone [Lentibacillus cibarius]TRM11887.1 nitrate reductase molybdenum cofactor assembly chaperone [Lentibacillus cibarius]